MEGQKRSRTGNYKGPPLFCLETGHGGELMVITHCKYWSFIWFISFFKLYNATSLGIDLAPLSIESKSLTGYPRNNNQYIECWECCCSSSSCYSFLSRFYLIPESDLFGCEIWICSLFYLYMCNSHPPNGFPQKFPTGFPQNFLNGFSQKFLTGFPQNFQKQISTIFSNWICTKFKKK